MSEFGTRDRKVSQSHGPSPHRDRSLVRGQSHQRSVAHHLEASLAQSTAHTGALSPPYSQTPQDRAAELLQHHSLLDTENPKY